MILQPAIGLTGAEVDGSIGRQTLAAAGQVAPAALINDLAARQRAYDQSLGNFQRCGAGWLARVARRPAAATTMATPAGAVAA